MYKVDMVKEFEEHFGEPSDKVREFLMIFSDYVSDCYEKGYNDGLKAKGDIS